MRRSPLLIVAAAMIILSACQSDAEPSAKKPRGEPTGIAFSDLPESLSTLTPYPTSKKPELEAPEGFEPVFAENVARHGARSLTSDDPLEEAIELWDEAKAANALTTIGKKFGPDVRALHNAMIQVGYGDLSTLGQEEMQGIGAREGERLSKLFDTAIADGAKIDVFDSGKGRAEESAENFSVGLSSVKPDLDIEPSESDEKILKFSNENDEYGDFLDDGPWKDDYNAARRLAKIDAISIEVLERLYKPDFVAGIEDPLEEAAGVYDVYRSAPAMSRDINIDSRQYVTKEAADAFAYVDDARYFYSRGPGIVGDDGSYQAAQILLDDFFSAIDDHLLESGKPSARGGLPLRARRGDHTVRRDAGAAGRRRAGRAGRHLHPREQRLPGVHRVSAVGQHRVDRVEQGRHEHRLDPAQRGSRPRSAVTASPTRTRRTSTSSRSCAPAWAPSPPPPRLLSRQGSSPGHSPMSRSASGV